MQQNVPLRAETVRGGEEKRWTIFGVEVVYLALVGICTALIGWLAENTVKALSEGVIDSRFHILPFISPYALVPFAVHIFLGNADSLTVFGRRIFRGDSVTSKLLSNLTCYLVICLAVFLGEFAVGNLWEVCFGVQLWNYSGLPLQVTQYAGLIPSLGYGTGAYVLFKFLYPALYKLFRRIPFRVAKGVSVVLGTLIVLDTLLMAVGIMVTGEAVQLWRVVLW